MAGLTKKGKVMKTTFFQQGYELCLKAPNEIHEICRREKEKLSSECEVKKEGLILGGQQLRHGEALCISSLNAGGGEIPIQTALGERTRGFFLLLFTLPLLATSYFLITWSLKPFEMGWITPLVALGSSIVVTVSFERILNLLSRLMPERASLIWRLFILLAAAVLAAVALVYLSLIRNNLAYLNMLSQQGAPGFDEAISRFYEKSLNILRMVFPLLTLALDLGAAVILHAAISKLASSNSTLKLLRQLERLRKRMVDMVVEIRESEILPEIFEREFLNGVAVAREELKRKEQIEKAKQLKKRELTPDEIEKNRLRNLSLAIVAFIFFLTFLIMAVKAFGSENVVVLVDMSISSDVKDYNGQSEFDKNLNAVEKVIRYLKPGAEIKILGITEDSFGKPYHLLSRSVGKNPGYFGQNTRRDIDSIVTEWKKSTDTLKANAKGTDILGALCLVESIFSANNSNTKILILFSDMRQTKGINLEKYDVVDPKMVDMAKKVYGVPDLKGVKVYAYGVHGNGRSQAYWNSLKKFWEQFLRDAGSELKVYSPLREVGL